MTNKPEVVAFYHANKTNPGIRGVTLSHDPSWANVYESTEPLIRLSDYEALQVEGERLREALLEAQATMTSALPFEPVISEVTKKMLGTEVDRIKSLLSEGGKKS